MLAPGFQETVQVSDPLDWLIVGGGIHGVHLAARLLGDAGVAPERLRIVDPADRLLERWRTVTGTVGMTHLRSPSVHHLDLQSSSLMRFAATHRGRRAPFAGPYNRPTLSLFNAHGAEVVKRFELDEQHLQGRAVHGEVDHDRVRVHLESGERLTTRNLLLAIGASERPAWPEWAQLGHARIRHIFEPGFDGWRAAPETVAVIGGGLSAAHVALRLWREGHRTHLVSRHPLREQRFDSDPGWLGPKYMAGFAEVRDYARRRSIITEARHRGSVPPAVVDALRDAVGPGRIQWHEAEVADLYAGETRVGLAFTSGRTLPVDRVLLATGFTPSRPGGPFVDSLIASGALPVAPCGYPILDSALRWHERVYVSGPLAELEIGPVARNIAGARRAGDRLVAAVKAGLAVPMQSSA